MVISSKSYFKGFVFEGFFVRGVESTKLYTKSTCPKPLGDDDSEGVLMKTKVTKGFLEIQNSHTQLEMENSPQLNSLSAKHLSV